MKSDEDFLKGVWQKIEIKRQYEMEKKMIFYRNKQLMIRQFIIYSLVMILFFILLVFQRFILKDHVYLVLFIILTFGYVLNNNLNNSQKEENLNGNKY